MNGQLLALALKKQRLQLNSEAQRAEWVACAAAVKPLCAGVDRLREAGGWLRRHPELLVGGVVVLAVARPRTVFRWLRRSFVAFRFVRRLNGWLA